MKKIFLAAATLFAIALTTTSCLKGGDNYPQPIDPAKEKDTIQKFIKDKGFNMVELKAKPQSGGDSIATGIMYEVLSYGDTAKFRPADTLPYVSIDVKGTLLNNTEFLSRTSADTKFPILVKVSNGYAIIEKPEMGYFRGSYSILTKIGKGGHIRCVLPSVYAYGPNSSGKVPANSPIFLDYKLVDVTKE